jgi:small subunit ribosomal protein S1
MRAMDAGDVSGDPGGKARRADVASVSERFVTEEDKPSGAEDFATLFAQSEATEKTHRRVRAGDLARGRVVALGAQSAFVAIGAKAEAVIDLAEFRNADTGEVGLAVGDQIEATVTDDGSRSGSIVLKRMLGRGGHVPGELEQALEHGIAVEGVVTGQNKGGFDVQISGHRAFCPSGQIDQRRGDPSQYVGQRLRFRVTKIEAGGRNIVVSRRQLLEDEASAQAKETWRRLEVGAVVRGAVTALREFGAFVDIGGVEGLIHVSELGYRRVGNPAEVLEVGQTVDAQVVKLEPDPGGGRGRVGLSLRALAPDPWQSAVQRFPAGTTVKGTVRRLEPFGAFVEIVPGLEGLVHVSRLALDRRISHPRQVVTIGDEVDVTVVSVDPEKRRIALSMVESARRARDAAEIAESREMADLLDRSKEAKTFGTLADLLAAPRKPKRQP